MAVNREEKRMTTHRVESWNNQQLSLLRMFFESAQAGDEVVFDQNLVDENGGQAFVEDCANKALLGIDEERARMLVDGITLRTGNLVPAFQKVSDQVDLGPAPEWEGDYWEDEPLPEAEVAVMVDERLEVAEEPREGDDPEADAWAAQVAAYHNRHNEFEPG